MEKTDNTLDITKLSREYGASIMQALAISQQNGTIKNPNDLEELISAGIETALEDYKEKFFNNKKTEIEL